jgi:hypothetical protein
MLYAMSAVVVSHGCDVALDIKEYQSINSSGIDESILLLIFPPFPNLLPQQIFSLAGYPNLIIINREQSAYLHRSDTDFEY